MTYDPASPTPSEAADDPSTKTRILEAAGPIFAERGFARATVRDICRAADVNVASIKYYFGDKQALYLATVQRAREIRAERYPFPQGNQAIGPEERLYEFVAALLRRLTALQTAPWPVQLLTRELMQPTDACRQLVHDHFQPMFDSLLRIVDQLSPAALPADQRLKVGFSIIGQCLHYRFGAEVVSLMVPESMRKDFGIEQIAHHITRFTLAALNGISGLPAVPKTGGDHAGLGS